MVSNTRGIRWLAVGSLILLSLAGCASAPKESGFIAQAEGVNITSRELRVRIYDYESRFAARVEEAADRIQAASADPAVRRNALLWKMNATSAIQEAVFQPDPLGGLLEAWVLTVQMEQFFREGIGREAFGDQQELAISVAQNLVADIENIARISAVSGDISKIKENVYDRVRSHPLDDLLFARETTVAYWAEYTGKDQRGGLAAVSSMEESFKDLLDRMRIYGNDIPKQGRWQAQLVLEDFLAENQIQDFFQEIETIQGDVNRLADDFDVFLAMVGGMYAGMVDSLTTQSELMMAFVETQRLDTLEQLRAERLAVMQDLQSERDAVMTQVDDLTLRITEAAAVRMEKVIDHLVWRLAQLMIGFLLLGAVVGTLVFHLNSRRQRAE